VLKRRWNAPVWLGFLVVLAAPFLYFSIFLRFPATRERPWLTSPVFAVGLVLMALGIFRAYLEPWSYRGKKFGTALGVISVAVLAFFGAGVLHFARQLPPVMGGPKVGEKAPDFTLPDKDGRLVTLSNLLESGPDGRGKVNGAVLIFYRGGWCPFCDSELRSLQESLGEFDRRHVSLVAISAHPPRTNRELCERQGYTFTFLSDPDAEATRRYDMLEAGDGQKGDGTVRPAEFLVDSTGIVRWVHPDKSVIVRTRPGEILKVIDHLDLDSTTTH
jgi:peroxiredoxin